MGRYGKSGNYAYCPDSRLHMLGKALSQAGEVRLICSPSPTNARPAGDYAQTADEYILTAVDRDGNVHAWLNGEFPDVLVTQMDTGNHLISVEDSRGNTDGTLTIVNGIAEVTIHFAAGTYASNDTFEMSLNNINLGIPTISTSVAFFYVWS